jgi:hypothetical protein
MPEIEIYDKMCVSDNESDSEEFHEQSINNRGPERRHGPGKYFPVIRVPANQLSEPLSVEAVYQH